MNVLLILTAVLAVSYARDCGHTTETPTSNPTEAPTTLQIPTTWPEGSFALPQTNDGCPGSEWKDGAFYQDTEDYHNVNTWNTTNMSGIKKKDGYLNTYCIMEGTTARSGSWPAGTYCILRKNGVCPGGFQEGSLLWDDENNYNMNHVSDQSTLPDGEFNKDTKLFYCCREDASPAQEIALPTSAPFYLLMKTGVCQSVAGMSVTVETMFWDDEDTNNHNAREGSTPFQTGSPANIHLNYCYYSPTTL
ncbi:uncharacterized protein LOC124136708 [Haliotis rufescens]|uniref:uncharacterized protein LOC124136708 n=1 Tax=Haliotis rufescens TaxID=6454 RepID=UPI00201E882E|nr:uncharacterized protein LOC124136708 [Haliotis rufescens]